MSDRGLYLDAFSGAAGDMLVASLLDLGASFEQLQAEIATLRIDGLRLRVERKWQGGLAGTHFEVLAPAQQPRRHLPQILNLLADSPLPPAALARARAVFQRLAEAEAKVHGCGVEEVHFHEVGAVDSLVDVLGFCLLYEQLGAPRLLCSPLAVGEGFVQTEHGKIPVPAMATFELLCGVPVEMSGLHEELVTPTGAALLSTLAEAFGRSFQFTPRRVGYGLGTRQRSDPPNAIRAVLVDLAGDAGVERMRCLEANLDDMTGQELARLLDLCLAAGAADVTILPATMKKGRPGHVLQVLAAEAVVDAVSDLLLRESTTLGVRCYPVMRRVLERRLENRETSLGRVRVKSCERPGGAPEVLPEFDELTRLAGETGLPLRTLRRRLEAELNREEPA